MLTTRFAVFAVLGAMVAPALAQAPAASIGRFPMEVDPAEYLERIQLPPGFRISIYRDDIEGARSMAVTPAGTLFIGTRSTKDRKRLDRVYAVATGDDATAGGEVYTVASGLNVPNGVAWREGSLYVAEVDKVSRLPNIESRLDNPPQPEVLNDTFPNEWHHGWKYLRFGPDGRLYVPVGAPCNICEVEGIQGTIVSIDADGGDLQVAAHGVRNSVGFDFHPQTGELWFTDNGRDLWGEDTPPEELNQVSVPGAHFGYPYRYGRDLVDEEFTPPDNLGEFEGAAVEFPAHNALLGMRFYTASQFPEDYHGDIFIASHGSWNRAIPDGYKVFRVRMEDGRAVGYEEFATGWLTEDKKYWGRPVDIEVMTDGSLLVSDDFNGLVYRISYEGEA